MTWDQQKQADPMLTCPELPGPSAFPLTVLLASLPEASGSGPQVPRACPRWPPLLSCCPFQPGLPPQDLSHLQGRVQEGRGRGACGRGQREAHPHPSLGLRAALLKKPLLPGARRGPVSRRIWNKGVPACQGSGNGRPWTLGAATLAQVPELRPVGPLLFPTSHHGWQRRPCSPVGGSRGAAFPKE